MLTHVPSKSEREIAAFSAFADICKWQIDRETVESRPEPEPDIRCRMQDGEYRAFELVEFVNENEARRSGWKRAVEDLLPSLVEHLPQGERSDFEYRFQNALIYLAFRNFPSINAIRDVSDDLFREMLNLPDEQWTIKAPFRSKKLARVLSRCHVSFGCFRGPMFSAQNIGGVGDPVTRSLSKKLTRTYLTQCPIELVAYLDVAAIHPPQFWRGPISRFGFATSGLGPFERIWIVDIRHRRFEFVVSGSRVPMGAFNANLSS